MSVTTFAAVPDQIQRDLDTFMAFYNIRCTHQGYRVQRRPPAKTLCDRIAEASAADVRRGPGEPLAS